jgi:hypothetical protein
MRGFAVPAIVVAVLVIAAPIVTAGCGPSLRRMHRSEVYFERCYAADFDPQVPIDERRACWQAWMEYWQRDQPIERVDYVRERILRLDPAHSAVVALAIGDAESESPAQSAEPTPRGSDVVSESATVIASSSELVEPSASVAVASEPDASAAETIDESTTPVNVILPAHERRRARTPRLPRTVSSHCAEACRPNWTHCTTRCSEGDRHACLRACELELRTCARACF